MTIFSISAMLWTSAFRPHNGTAAQRRRQHRQLAENTKRNRIARSGANTVVEITFAGDNFLGIAMQISFPQLQEMGFEA